MSIFSLQALNDEIDSDPEVIGYKVGSVWKGDQEIADLLNAKNFTVDRVSVEMESIRSAVTYDAYNNLAIDEQEWLRWMTPNSGLMVVTADMKLNLSGRGLTANGVAGSGDDGNSFWAVANRDIMAPVMLALIEVAGSRAEVLWTVNTTVSAGQVGAAANL